MARQHIIPATISTTTIFTNCVDIAEDFDFNVTWDGTNQRVDIITTESYVPEDETETPTTPEEPEQPEEEIPPRYNSEFEEAYDTLDYDEVNPDYQAQVDAFPGTPVTVSVDSSSMTS